MTWTYDSTARTYVPPAGTGPHRHDDDQSRLTSLEARATILEAHRSGEIVTVVSYQAVAGVGNTASASYVDYPGPQDITMVKKYSAALSKLVVFGTVGCYKGAGTGNVQIGLKFGATDHTIGNFFFNDLATHRNVSCQDDTFSGLGAGSLTGRVRWLTSSVDVNSDANDAVRLTLMEVMI